jgi:hypothetical protein
MGTLPVIFSQCNVTGPHLWSREEFLAANPEVPGSIPDAARFSEQQRVWNGVHSGPVRISEELLIRKVAAPI